jgi:dCMP deaminase
MDWALRSAQLSHAVRLQVGAVIVKDDSVISYGYNGMPAGWDNNCEDRVYANEWSIDNNEWQYKDEAGKPYNLKTNPEVLHAESNAIAKLAKSSSSGNGASIFITHAPCHDCAKLIYQSGISSVYYRSAYRDNAGLEFLEKSGIEVKQINKETK